MRSPYLRFIERNGERLAVWDWQGDGPPLLFAHATGFHGRCWDRIIEQFPERRCLAVDKRGHGRSSKPEPPYHWHAFGEDLAAVAEHFGIRDAIGIGHSMGGHTTVQCAALRPETYRALLLVDPSNLFQSSSMAALRQTRCLRTAAEESLGIGGSDVRALPMARTPFATWRPEILRDYCDYGLQPGGRSLRAGLPAGGEGVDLREFEDARIGHLRAGGGGATSGGGDACRAHAGGFGRVRSQRIAHGPDLAARFANGREIEMPEANHFIPMEHPEQVAAEIRLLDSKE